MIYDDTFDKIYEQTQEITAKISKHLDESANELDRTNTELDRINKDMQRMKTIIPLSFFILAVVLTVLVIFTASWRI